MMKRLVYTIVMALILGACKGPQGETGGIGPQGAKGEKGETGAVGAAGQNAAMPRYYDFTLDFRGGIESQEYEMKQDVGPEEFVLVFYRSLSSAYILPYNDLGFTSDGKDFVRVNFKADFEFGGGLLFIDNFIDAPYGKTNTFRFRAVVLKASPGSRLNLERYQDYANLKADYNLPD